MKKNIFSKVTIASMLTSLVTPLAILVPQASAAVDTCTWTGGGTGTEDTTVKSWTYDMSDAANWSGCDNGMVPEDGDSLVFPSGLAVVDPDNSEDDDYAWSYRVNNNLADGISFANITFSGATNDDYNVYEDVYTLEGNSISLSGDVDYQYTGTTSQSRVPQFWLAITTTAPVTITANSTGGIDSGSNDLFLCDSSTPNAYMSIGGTLNVGGDLIIGCDVNLNPTSTSTIGDIAVENDARLSGDPRSFAKSSSQTVTVKDGAQFSFSGYGVNEELVVPVNIVYQGAGSTTGYCTSNDYNKCGTGGEAFVEVTGFRGYWTNNYYDSVAQKSMNLPIKLTGNVTLSSNTVVSTYSEINITGTVSGDYTLGLAPGSGGSLKSSKGVAKAEMYKVSLVDTGFDIYLNYGQNGVLSESEKIDYMINVREGSTLSGVGEVNGIEVEEGGTLAPGNSPGCIVSTGDLTLAGNYDVELAGETACSGYDRTTVTGAVDITGATLNLSLLDGFIPALNGTFSIIENDAADPVVGTFSGLAEGATFEVNGVTLSVSYTGGDGNDVVLTATAIPATATTPDTGIGSILASPATSVIALLLTGATLVGFRRLNLSKK